MLRKVTPLMVVEAIEPCLEFWVDRLGLAKVAEVPMGETLGFVILAGQGIELMLQTRASLDEDLPGVGACVGGVLYFEVEDLEPLIGKLEPATVVAGPRTTFYGAHEVWVREPGGALVGFAAQRGEAS